MSRIIVGTLCVLALAACSEPFATIPGGELAGSMEDPPLEWQSVPETIQLESRPTNPYSINIWSVGLDRDLYIATSADGTTWSAFIAEDRAIKVRLGERIYPLHAAEVNDPTERGRVAAAYLEKYDVDENDGWVQRGLIFRLDRR